MSKALHYLARIEEFLLAAIIILMVVLYSGAVLAREISIDLARRTEWIDEATRYLMVWMVFLGLGLALARGKHIAMDSYQQRMSEGTRLIVRRAIDAVGLVFCVYIAWFGADITMLVFKSGQTSPTLGMSNAILYLALPVGFALLALRYAASLFGIIDRFPAADAPATDH
jgi:TRAP-type C4-dicarboxylate transport system permease small subunit